MLFAFYQFLALFLFVLYLPRVLWLMWKKGKYKKSFLRRLGIGMFSKEPPKGVIFAHAVSVGEVKALSGLLKALHEKNPSVPILLSTVTETGYAEARRSLPFVEEVIFLPFDFFFLMNRLVYKVQPKLLLFCETDLWWGLLRACKRKSVPTVLVNGKISEKSVQRLRYFPFYTKALFPLVDLFCMQNTLYQEHLLSLGVPNEKTCVTGNLKFDQSPPYLGKAQKKELLGRLNLNKELLFVCGSTHQGEETLLLELSKKLWEEGLNFVLVLVPRHPERFLKVIQEARELLGDIATFSSGEKRNKEQKLFVVDAMGQLCHFYELADLTLVAGSLVPGIGGHNICEPAFYEKPVLYGPYMESQKELCALVEEYQAGVMCTEKTLYKEVKKLLLTPSLRDEWGKGGKALASEMQGSSERTLCALDTLNKKKFPLVEKEDLT